MGVRRGFGPSSSGRLCCVPPVRARVRARVRAHAGDVFCACSGNSIDEATWDALKEKLPQVKNW